MEIAFWEARWKENRIGFHEGKPNALLSKHIAHLGETSRVLVPLCGKTEDMAFLRTQGHEVVGIEAVEDAVAAFFRERGIEPHVHDHARVRVYRGEGVTIITGDVFACTKEDVGSVTALYDRAALVALPEPMRAEYAAHLQSLLEPDARGLLITFDYDQARMQGPPFAVSSAEVARLWPSAKLLDEVSAESPRFQAAGVPVVERCFLIKR